MKQQYAEKVKSMTGEQFMDTLNSAKTANAGTALLMARGCDRFFDLNDMASIPSDQRGGAFTPSSDMGWKRCQPPYDKYFASYDGKIKGPQGGVLATSVNNAGYELVGAIVNGNTTSTTVHRLVASAWLPNPSGLSDVDHVSGDRTLNRADALRWISHKDNLAQAHRMKQMAGNKGAKNRGVAVMKIDADGTRTEYRSLSAAGRDNGLSAVSVTGNARHTLKLDKPFHFEFLDTTK
ncbi:HNH endonuclease family protein [Lacticaseibacillus daqingensis]|uniref:HNH endonuclease n=1 Tax=Lacticaseibacillus daqingensis TaxID=2486014 RepID=UPI000F77AC8D|nr:HNH endonuclease [Lacticaseibacillus daqingensis]